MSALPSGNERLFQQGLSVRGAVNTIDATTPVVIDLFRQDTGAAVVLAGDEIFVLDSFELTVSIDTQAIIFFDNDDQQDESVESQWISNVFLPLDIAWRGRFNERSAPQSLGGGTPMFWNSAANDCSAIILGSIRKTILKSLQPAKV